MDETAAMRMSTGRYINFFTDNGKHDIFIIINEANDINDQDIKEAIDKIDEIDDLLREKIADLTDDELQEILEPMFEYGVQIIRK